MSQSMSVGKPSTSSQLPLPPGPRGHFFWGVLPELRRDMLGLYHTIAPQYGDIVRLRYAGVDTLASIAQRYQLRLVPGHPVQPNPVFTLRTSHGLPMTAERRH